MLFYIIPTIQTRVYIVIVHIFSWYACPPFYLWLKEVCIPTAGRLGIKPLTFSMGGKCTNHISTQMSDHFHRCSPWHWKQADLFVTCFPSGENKSRIVQALQQCKVHPMTLLESWYHRNNDNTQQSYTRREVGFCAGWCLDNLCK